VWGSSETHPHAPRGPVTASGKRAATWSRWAPSGQRHQRVTLIRAATT
jgi:hypothetical protein